MVESQDRSPFELAMIVSNQDKLLFKTGVQAGAL